MKDALRKFLLAGRAVVLSKVGVKTPLIVSHTITFRCNLSCKYCGIWKTPRREMSTSRIFSAMEEFATAGCISWNISGGEPFLRKDIDAVIRKGNELGMAMSVNTNGFFVREHLSACRELDLLSISLDGPQAVHDLMRGKGSFKRALAGAKLAKSGGVRVSLMAVISPATMADGCKGIRDLIKLSGRIGIPLAFQPLHGDRYNRLGRTGYAPLAFNHPNYRTAISIIEREKSRKPDSIRMSGAYISKLAGGPAGSCKAGVLFCSIFPDGSVGPCIPREDASIDGNKKGFLEAFRKLPEYNKCNCYMNCHSEWNYLLSLGPGSVLHYVLNYA
jgi:MoaA/NifB/PqqE/SkfB family radical SAM enzyme